MTHKQQEAYKTHNTYLSVAYCPQPDSLLTDMLVSGGVGGGEGGGQPFMEYLRHARQITVRVAESFLV